MMTNRRTVLTGYRLIALATKDRKRYGRLHGIFDIGYLETERSGNTITKCELLEVSVVKPEPIDFNSDLGAPKAIEPCPWCCPTTCLNCGIENCEDRLAGGPDVTP